MTNLEMFNLLLTMEEVKSNSELVDKIKKNIETLENKKANSKKEKDYSEIINNIIAGMQEIGEPTTIDNLRKTIPTLSEYSNQKINAMLIKMKEQNLVDNKKDGKKSLYFLV